MTKYSIFGQNFVAYYFKLSMKPQFCDANASCQSIDFYGMAIEACVCNDGFAGNGCRCDNKDTCDDLCEEKMTGSECRKESDGDGFYCRCPKGIEY